MAASATAGLRSQIANGPLTDYVPVHRAKGKEDEGRRTFKRTPEMIKRFVMAGLGLFLAALALIAAALSQAGIALSIQSFVRISPTT